MRDSKRGPDHAGDARGSEGGHLDALFHCLSNGTRRRLLGHLYEQAPDALTRRDLATHLVPGYHDLPPADVSDDAFRRGFAALRHSHLPKLDAAGLIEQRTSREAVELADHPAFDDEGIVSVISGETDVESGSLDALFSALADGQRRTILDVLSHQFGPIHRETLARELGASERDVAESEVSTETVERLLVSLSHVHLPHLSDAGLIEYDADEQTVAYVGHPELRVQWTHSVLEPRFRPSLTGESEPAGIGEIDGREQVVSFGQSLCDRADEDLFCMFTDTDLLEAGCFTRIRDASRRGVDVYLGTRDPTVVEYIQEHAPAVTLWEPNADWLHMPVAEGRVGRLLLVDREAVMLGTIAGDSTDDVAEEQAIIAEGADSTLATMVRQLVAPHLEQLDDQSEEIESRLPF